MIRIQMWKEKIRWDDSLEAFAGGGGRVTDLPFMHIYCFFGCVVAT